MNIVKLTDLVSNGSKIRKTVDPKVVLQKGDYPEGTILDANSIVALIQQYAGGSTGKVGSEQIEDGSIMLKDLNTEIIAELNKHATVEADYDSENERLNFSSVINNIN